MKANCRITFDGYMILAEQSFHAPDNETLKGLLYSWQFPIGMSGTPHFITVEVSFRNKD